VAQAFGLNVDAHVAWQAKVAGYPQRVYLSPPDAHFPDMNVLGMDFCSLNGFLSRVRAGDRNVTYYIGNDWEVKLKPKL
jgi:hypothetical protein